jgi:hypothetical protein
VIHLNYYHRSQFLDNFDVFFPDLTNMRENNCFCTFQCWFSPKTLVMYLDRFIFVSIHGIHLKNCPRTPFLGYFGVFLPDLTCMREKYLFLHFPIRVFTKNLSNVLIFVSFHTSIGFTLNIAPEIYFLAILMFSCRI